MPNGKILNVYQFQLVNKLLKNWYTIMGREARIFRQKYELHYKLKLGFKKRIDMLNRRILIIIYASSETIGIFLDSSMTDICFEINIIMLDTLMKYLLWLDQN